MLTCIAEGRTADDDEEKNVGKGPALVCDLTLTSVHASLELSDKKLSTSDESRVSKLVTETAKRAADLTKLTLPADTSNTVTSGTLHKGHIQVPPVPKKKQREATAAPCSSFSQSHLGEWRERYRTWARCVFENRSTHTPTPRQAHVLHTIHYRTVQEEYDIACEPVPEEVWQGKPPDVEVGMPLFRMVHGLPGSGKSRLIKWLKEYFEQVWLWTQEKQYAIVAPMNTMADNIGGTTIHSFARIAFKDKRGFMIQPGRMEKSKVQYSPMSHGTSCASYW